jgi:hypothetical protein
MSPEGLSILEHLREVALERQRRALDPVLAQHTQAVKDYQHRRFARSYADLMAMPRYARAARFFLDDLYGPRDFSDRDDQFARVVPGLVRLFPREIVATVQSLAELHALSERLDSKMAALVPALPVDAAHYVLAWQATGHAPERERQIDLMLRVGEALERYTRNPMLRHSLRLMRGPARAAGLAALQSFLETGFDTFREMRGSSDFLRTVSDRERALAAALFAATDVADATSHEGPLGQLP